MTGMQSEASETEEPIAERARHFAPVVWLLGKVQSGKTSIIRELTQATDAEIGAGFAACTKTAQVFDFPAAAPIIRFLDTRGLDEPGYDPAEDKRRYFVTPSGLTIVTRDASLFENPVDPEFGNRY